MDFDPVSGFLSLAGFLLGLLFLVNRLLANRCIEVRCVLHGREGT